MLQHMEQKGLGPCGHHKFSLYSPYFIYFCYLSRDRCVLNFRPPMRCAQPWFVKVDARNTVKKATLRSCGNGSAPSPSNKCWFP
jgi:hypothetical protein